MKILSIGIIILIMLGPVAADQASSEDIWEQLRFLEGVWAGTGEGASGDSILVQEYEFVLNGNFLRMKTRAEFKPQEKNPQGEIHEDFGIFSYDQSRRLFVLRGFYAEGFVNQYTGRIEEDGKSLIFESENIENAPPGTKARLEYIWKDSGELEQGFYVAFPGREFSCFVKNTLRRK